MAGQQETGCLIADACNIGDWIGKENMQKAIDDLKGHCEALGREYATVEKTCLCTMHLTGGDTAEGVNRQIFDQPKMGFTHTIFNVPDVYKITSLETFAKEIIPAAASL